MKRVKAACICQTLLFSPKEPMDQEAVAKLMQEEVLRYKQGLERTQYRIVEEQVNTDGTVQLKIIKQYNTSPMGEYLG